MVKSAPFGISEDAEHYNVFTKSGFWKYSLLLWTGRERERMEERVSECVGVVNA